VRIIQIFTYLSVSGLNPCPKVKTYILIAKLSDSEVEDINLQTDSKRALAPLLLILIGMSHDKVTHPKTCY
jgi:hypothetical protein